MHIISDIVLLLKSSDSVVHDLCHAYDSCRDKTISRPPHFYLALRKWYPSLRPEMEFRCFVHAQQLVGISQCEVRAHYPAMLEKKDSIILRGGSYLKISRLMFMLQKIGGSYPWCASTLPLLFTWEELEQGGMGEEDVDFRIVESQLTVRPGMKTAVPYDYNRYEPWESIFKECQ